MELSNDQQYALNGILDYIQSPHKRTVRLSGAAGTGKTTILAEIARRCNAAVITPTNRAADVLRRKGIPASTIHSQIYNPLSINLADRLHAIEQSLEALKTKDDPDELDEQNVKKLTKEKQIVQRLLDASEDDTHLSFSFKEDNNLTGKAVIVDEASMVGEELLDDIIKSEPRCVVLVGDHNQLPPVKDAPIFQGYNPDWRLTQQHRTSNNSGILTTANSLIADGTIAAWRTAGAQPDVVTASYKDIAGRELNNQAKSGELLEQKSIWITHTNKTRVGLNRVLRKNMGRIDPLPLQGDILVTRKTIYCKSPDRDKPLFAEEGGSKPSGKGVFQIPNGTFAIVSNIVQMRTKNKNNKFGRLVTVTIHGQSINVFLNESDFSDEAQERFAPWQYGYCLTAHRAQGSEWDKVTLVSSPSLRRLSPVEMKQWIYTTITRAKKKLIWISYR